jgi:hypothetical protein
MADCENCAELKRQIAYLRDTLLAFTGAETEMDLFSLKVVYDHTKNNGKEFRAVKALLETMEIEEHGDERKSDEEMSPVQKGSWEVPLPQECCTV